MAIVPSFIPGGDAINNAVSSFLDGGVVGMETIRRINYDAQYLWTVNFEDNNGFKPPSPFDDFFPASDLSLGIGTVNTHAIEMGQSAIRFPRNSAPQSIDITFYDDETRSLNRWMSDWVNLDLFNLGDFVSGINDSHRVVAQDSFGNSTRNVYPMRHIRIALLDRFKSEVITYNYRVVPDGDFGLQLSQASEATQFTMKFNIVEEMGRPKKGNKETFDFVKSVLGRFI